MLDFANARKIPLQGTEAFGISCHTSWSLLKTLLFESFLHSVGMGVGPGVRRKATHHWGFGQ